MDAPGGLHHIVIRGIKRKAIFKDDTDREDFGERLSSLLHETVTPGYAWALMTSHVRLLLRTGIVPIASIMRRLLTGYVATQNLSISGSEVARRFKVDRSAIRRTTQRLNQDPELPAATKTVQRELEID
ncbi:MAG: hypothetical protein WBN03_05325 [Desulfobacterales bacterium]